ncbi:MAG: hypothetical protein A3G34_16900 [Candidatus Lindowbacteria bacterium RIFCSPLOWO2_12_FULL_62_27]|nr:MAG: hypothetical protein A3I06_02215 [Candidatus Lindowbacteria bacterium RIFCSPLOWO2_02_FULL_62_12]OGH60999.1 MAG: hypothetical protein A3G34_16900 [Candidatus Lindowbacteria bacterium RIFCSPLOWO2_12_FULL_62_27]
MGVSIFEGLAPYEIDIIAEALYPRSLKAGAEIIREGSFSECMFIILSGKVRVEKDINRTPRPVWYLNAGDCFGEMSLFDRLPRSASVYADTDVDILLMYRVEMEEMFERHPHIAYRVMIQLFRTVSIRMRQVLAQLGPPTPQAPAPAPAASAKS